MVLGLLCIGIVLLAQTAGKKIQLANNEILFTATLEDRHIGTYWMDIAHGLFYRLPNKNFIETQPVWSPDGKQIAYVSAFSRGNIIGRSIYVQDTESMTVRPLIDDPIAEFSPAWSPDGRFIAYGTSRFDGSPELMVTDVQARTSRRLTDNRHSDNHPTWSPDGRFIAYAADPTFPGNTEIDVIDLQSGAVRPLVSTPNRETNPAWSPDGRYILYVADLANLGIYVWDMLQNQAHLIYPTLPLGPNPPGWSADSRFIIFADNSLSGRTGIFQLEIAPCLQRLPACLPQRLTVTPGLFSVPQWRPNLP